MYYLKNDEGEFLKNINTSEGVIEFTPNKKEAKPYLNGEWFATTELEFIKFHFEEDENVATL